MTYTAIKEIEPMSDASSNVVQINRAHVSPSTDEMLLRLADALQGRSVPHRRQSAIGTNPTPDEGLALIQGYTSIADHELRQVLLDVVSTLSRPADE